MLCVHVISMVFNFYDEHMLMDKLNSLVSCRNAVCIFVSFFVRALLAIKDIKVRALILCVWRRVFHEKMFLPSAFLLILLMLLKRCDIVYGVDIQ